MIRPVIGTIAARIAVAAMNLLVVMAVGHRAGAEGLGGMSLIVLGVTLVLVLHNAGGAGVLTYLVPRYPLRALLLRTYAWGVFTAAAAWALLGLLPIVPKEHVADVVLLAALQGVATVHSNVLLGWQRIAAHNLLAVTQAVLLLAAYVVLAELLGGDLSTFVRAAAIAYATVVVLSAALLWSLHPSAPPVRLDDRPLGRALFGLGGTVQLANLAQLLNYRLAYWLIEHFRDRSVLGLYSVSTQLAESAWLAPKSLGTVLYARVSNDPEAASQRAATLSVAKASMAIATAAVLVLALVPDPLYQALFGREVRGVQSLVLLLAPGIVAMALSQALSHYFSGTGRMVHNLAGSSVGLVATAVLGFLLVPIHGLEGAAITASIAYGANAVYQLVVFLRTTGAGLLMLLPSASDGRAIAELWRSARKR
jgi:O-antigen/teichoic acid export membrane protein